MLIDTHCHLNRQEFDGDRQDVMARAREAGVERMINVGYDLATSEVSVALAQEHPDVLATVGVHPHDALLIADADGAVHDEGRAVLARLEELAARPRVVAIGEIGLDYFRDLSPRPAQHAAFRAQLALAEKVGLPVVFHIRDAYAEAFAEIESAGLPSRRGILHAFAAGREEARWGVERGFLLGIGGPVTYKNGRLPDVLATVTPRDVVLETDSPWLPPVPYRGKRNEPSYVTLTAARVAAAFDLDVDQLATITRANLATLLGGEELL